MIGVSLPEECFRPFGDVLKEIRRSFPLWEVVSEVEHDVRRVSGEMAAAGGPAFQVHAPFSDVNPASLNDRFRQMSVETLAETIEASAKAGAKIVTVHPGIISPMSSYRPEKAFTASIESLRALSKVADDCGVQLAVENMPTGSWAFMSTAAEVRWMRDETGLGLCFDIGHAHIAGTEAELLELADAFVNVHVHDNGGGRDEHAAVGSGKADFAGLRRALRGYKGNIVIEARSMESALESKRRLEAMGF